MSDGRSSAADSGAESDDSDTESDSSGPGGGPKRVVSETSVDDILDSLDDAQSSEPDVTDETDKTDVTDDRDEAAPATQLDGDYVESVADDVAGDESADSGTVADDPVVETESEETAEPAGSESQPDTERDAESTAADDSSLSDDQLDALADRVEQGTVTGADVRAAEAGEGREETSDIGDIELTMDDLEATVETTGASPTDDAADHDADTDADAGPLAGSIDEPEGTADADAADDVDADDTDDESSGFFDRLRGLFFG